MTMGPAETTAALARIFQANAQATGFIFVAIVALVLLAIIELGYIMDSIGKKKK